MRRNLTIFSCGFMTALASGCLEGKADEGPIGTLDDDQDGFDISSDCDDADADVNPDAVEICEDNIDNDCRSGDAECPQDDDNDGFIADDDCDDNDPDINPDAQEDCMLAGDENCDRFDPLCILPDMTYAPTTPGNFDAYGVGVFADHVVFGEPNGGEPDVGDGRALFFSVESAGVVDETEAALVSEGEVGSLSAYGTVITPVGRWSDQFLCIGGDYWDDVGKSWCFEYAAVSQANGSLELTDATFTTAGGIEDDCASTDSEADVNGDSLLDLLVYTSHGVHVILGDGNPWSGDYVVPNDAAFTLGDCANSISDWCGFARALMPGYATSLAISKEGGPSPISIYDSPLAGTTPPPDATVTVDRMFADSATAIGSQDVFAFGNSFEDEVTFIDPAGNVVGTLRGPNDSSFGYWLSTTTTWEGEELLLVGAPDAASPEPGSSARGLVYVFDIGYVGIPTIWKEAEYILLPPSDPSDFENCGHRARGGIVYTEMDAYMQTTIATACRGYGGAAYHLYREWDGARLVAPEDIYAVGTGDYEIREWVVNAFKTHLHWVKHLAQTEAVRNAQEQIVGWRLHAIAVDSPLYRAGLRNGDVIRKINGVDVTTPAVVNSIYDSVQNSSSLTVGFVRAGTPKLFSYAIVP